VKTILLSTCFSLIAALALSAQPHTEAAPALPSPDEMNGVWIDKGNRFEIRALERGRLQFEFSGTYHFPPDSEWVSTTQSYGEGRTAQGTLAGIVVLEGNVATIEAVFEAPHCRITLTFIGGKLAVQQEGFCRFEHPITADGNYTRIDFTAPPLRDTSELQVMPSN